MIHAPAAVGLLLLLASTTPPGGDQATATTVQPQEYAYGPDVRQRLDLYYPQSASSFPAPALILIHGGGWAAGDKCVASDRTDCPYVSPILKDLRITFQDRAFVIVPNHRFSPDYHWPAQLDDIRSVLNWVAFQTEIDPARVVVMGESSGAHLGAMASFESTSTVAAFLGHAGVYDFTAIPTGDAVYGRITQLLNCERDLCPRLWVSASPQYRRSRPLPTLLMHGTSDIFLSPLQTIAFGTTRLPDVTTLILDDYPHSGPSYTAVEVTAWTHAFLAKYLFPPSASSGRPSLSGATPPVPRRSTVP